MEKSKPKLLNIEKGFSLFEIVIALVILSASLLVIYNLILSTSVSVYKLEDHYLAKEVANNRIALINTIEKPSKPLNRNGMAQWVVRTGDGKNHFIMELVLSF